MTNPVYRRVVVKVSGEALMGPDNFGIHQGTLERIAGDLIAARALGVSIGVVVGGGNIFRGIAPGASHMDRATADYMGMLATVMNALALQDAMRRVNLVARVQSALNVEQVVEPYIRGKAMRYLEEGKVVIFAAGTGNPFFTTDTAAALRALEIGAEAILMAKNAVRGVYDGDPRVDADARFLPDLTHLEAIERGLKVMDTTALSLCMDNKLPIVVFDLTRRGNIRRIVTGEPVGSVVSADVSASRG